MDRGWGSRKQAGQDSGKANSLDCQLPAQDYLCQVDANISCGACCGLYNVSDPSRSALVALLQQRSHIFAATVKGPADVEPFARHMASIENQARPFADFHHCPFLGLVGRQHSTVGCLLHPEANGGLDMRGLSYYGGMACRVYFCQSTRLLPVRYKAMVKAAAPHWHWYGLVITEHRLVTSILSRLEKMLPPESLPGLVKNPEFRKALCRLLGLKIEWPFRPKGCITCCHHLFAEDHPGRPELPADMARAISPGIRAIIEAIGSQFADQRQLAKACHLVNRYFEAALRAAAGQGAC